METPHVRTALAGHPRFASPGRGPPAGARDDRGHHHTAGLGRLAAGASDDPAGARPASAACGATGGCPGAGSAGATATGGSAQSSRGGIRRHADRYGGDLRGSLSDHRRASSWRPRHREGAAGSRA
ncbi:hypothetical protein EOM89_11440 [Candidatus Falkowbacteria bacterium]|nr:hypothetical protein [Candidatus Falkowbacteria bacterium]